MRLHVQVDDLLVARVDAIAGRRRRSKFVRKALLTAVEHHERWRLIESAAGSVPDRGHEWDADPAAWIRAGRRLDPTRVG